MRSFFRSDPDLPHSLVALSGWGVALLLGVAGGALALILSWRVDVNEFSMHHFYKNRLVRCYLGGARARNSRAPIRLPASIPTTTFRSLECTSKPGRQWSR